MSTLNYDITDDVYVYSSGLIYCSVCTSLDDEATEAQLNAQRPTGIDSQWTIAEDKRFASGEPNPCQCHDDPKRRHVLFSC